jgi:AmmeMemoRadiSam system protein A
MSSLPSDERRALLELARRAICEAVLHNRYLETPMQFAGELPPAGVFVTLHRQGRLRGCIGQLEGIDSLQGAVVYCAVAAAMHDPRFPPVAPEEIAELGIEISILSRPERIEPSQIQVGRHGLLVTRGRMRGVLLPQVPVQFHWNAQRFLEECCRKAGLDRDAWKDPATRIEAFTSEVFSEADLAAHPRAQAS